MFQTYSHAFVSTFCTFILNASSYVLNKIEIFLVFDIYIFCYSVFLHLIHLFAKLVIFIINVHNYIKFGIDDII